MVIFEKKIWNSLLYINFLNQFTYHQTDLENQYTCIDFFMYMYMYVYVFVFLELDICVTMDCLINWIVFDAVSAIFKPKTMCHNGHI